MSGFIRLEEDAYERLEDNRRVLVGRKGQSVSRADAQRAGVGPSENKEEPVKTGLEAVSPTLAAHEQQRANLATGEAVTAEETPGPRSAEERNADAAGEMDATGPARTLAQKSGLDLADVTGTGQDGRITKADVEATLSGQNE